MLILTEHDVRAVLTVEETIAVNHLALSYQDCACPPRTILPFPQIEGASLFMPAALYNHSLGVKVVSVRPDNANQNLPTVPATVLLFDEQTALPISLISATYLTGLRTAAGSAAVVQALARSNITEMCCFGAGLQARLHVLAMKHIHKSINRVRVFNRTSCRAEDFVEWVKANTDIKDVMIGADAETEVYQADVIVTATNSSTPVLKGEWIRSGAIVIAVGAYTPQMQEIDATTVNRASVIVDTDAARDVGDFMIPVESGEVKDVNIVGTAGEVLRGEVSLKDEDMDIVVFKSVGTALQDVATAQLAFTRAVEFGVGHRVDM